MANQDYAEQLARAWAFHRQSQNDEAIQEFNRMLQISQNNIDALYGLGLAERSAGRIDAARTTLERCLGQVQSALEAHPNEDRYEMLEKMINQRLSEIRALKTS